jgi:hypothetical protein
MKSIYKPGIYIGVLCGLWQLVMGLTGWYKDPALYNMFFLVILIQVGVLIWGLKQTAQTKSYGGQVGAGTLMSLVAGGLIIIVSILFTGLFFPKYFEEVRSMMTGMYKVQGKSDQEIASLISAAEWSETPIMTALSGFLGTMVTGLVASLIIAIFLRKKAQP